MPDGNFDYYPRYRELRNRADSGGNLTSAETSELDVLEAKLRDDSKSIGNLGEDADQLDSTLGDSTLGDALLTPPKPERNLPSYDEQVDKILKEPGSKQFGFTKQILAGMGKDAVADLYTQLFPASTSDAPTDQSSQPQDASSADGGLPVPPPRPTRFSDETPNLDRRTPSSSGRPPSPLPPSPLPPRPPPPPRPSETGDDLGHVYDPTDPKQAGSGPQQFTPPPSGGGGKSGGIPVPVPVGTEGEDGTEKDASDTVAEDPRGPWALETSTQARLIEIRDALTETGKGSKATGQDGEEGSENERAVDDALDVFSRPGAGRNQSGSNLGSLGRTGKALYGKYKKLFKGRSRPTGKPSAPKAGTSPKAGSPPPKAGPPPAAGGSAGAGAGGSAAGGSSTAAGGAAAGEASTAAAAGTAAAGLALVALAAFEAGKMTYAFARAQEKEIRNLAEFGGQQAIGVAELDVGRVQRDVKTAQETGDSSRNLTDSLNNFEEKLQPIESLLTNIANTLGGRMLDQVSSILSPITEIVKVINMLYDVVPSKWKSKKTEDEVPFDRLKQIAEETMRQNQAKFPTGSPNAPQAGGRMFP